MSYHAFLPPSGAGAWVHCALWPTMNMRYPQPPTDDTREGDAAHWALQRYWIDGEIVQAGDTDPTGYPLTEQILRDIKPVGEAFSRLRNASNWFVGERYLPCASVHRNNGGSPDGAFLDSKSRSLVIADFKYGHDSVKAEENWQCLNYAIAVADTIGWKLADFERVTFQIYQPRDFMRGGGPFKSWSISGKDLGHYFLKLQQAANAAHEPQPVAKTGDHCRYCPGRSACRALQQTALNVATVASVEPPQDLEPDLLGKEYKFLLKAETLLKARLSALQDSLLARLEKGEVGFGWSIDSSGTTARRWTIEPKEAAKLGIMAGVDIRKPLEVRTPSQAIQAGIPKEIVEQYSKRGQGKPVLVPTEETMAFKAFTSNPVKE